MEHSLEMCKNINFNFYEIISRKWHWFARTGTQTLFTTTNCEHKVKAKVEIIFSSLFNTHASKSLHPSKSDA